MNYRHCAVLILLAAGLITSVMAMHAHHSLAGVYDSNRQVTVEGTVTQFHFVNPHPYLTVEVKKGSETQQWRLEMDNLWELSDIGVTNETFKPGDRIVASGMQARSQSPGLYIRRLDRPADGFSYEQIGSSPRIRVPSKGN